jgi:hypothetical protein
VSEFVACCLFAIFTILGSDRSQVIMVLLVPLSVFFCCATKAKMERASESSWHDQSSTQAVLEILLEFWNGERPPSSRKMRLRSRMIIFVGARRIEQRCKKLNRMNRI